MATVILTLTPHRCLWCTSLIRRTKDNEWEHRNGKGQYEGRGAILCWDITGTRRERVAVFPLMDRRLVWEVR